MVKMFKVEAYESKIAITTSFSAGLAVVVTAFLTFWEHPLFDEYILLAVVLAIFPHAVMTQLDRRWKRSIDKQLPELFRTIVQAQQTGMTIPQSLEEASKRDYGPLTGELKKMVAQLSWGMSFEGALKSFNKRVNTPLATHMIPLIIEASNSGGNVENVFNSTGKFIQSQLLLEKKQRIQTRPYIAIIYVAFFVFLFTVVILSKTFFTQIGVESLAGFSTLAYSQVKRLFFHMSSIQAMFSGLVAGKMGEGSAKDGLKHCVILLVCGYLAFKFGM